MNVIELHSEKWTSRIDVHEALARALYERDGQAVANRHNVNALLELLVWDVCGGVQTPSVIRVSGLYGAPEEVRDEITHIQQLVAEACAESKIQQGVDVDIRLEIVD